MEGGSYYQLIMRVGAAAIPTGFMGIGSLLGYAVTGGDERAKAALIVGAVLTASGMLMYAVMLFFSARMSEEDKARFRRDADL